MTCKPPPLSGWGFCLWGLIPAETRQHGAERHTMLNFLIFLSEYQPPIWLFVLVLAVFFYSFKRSP